MLIIFLKNRSNASRCWLFLSAGNDMTTISPQLLLRSNDYHYFQFVRSWSVELLIMRFSSSSHCNTSYPLCAGVPPTRCSHRANTCRVSVIPFWYQRRSVVSFLERSRDLIILEPWTLQTSHFKYRFFKGVFCWEICLIFFTFAQCISWSLHENLSGIRQIIAVQDDGTTKLCKS
jgi:hypothetical protein